jgi:hypothetical protein
MLIIKIYSECYKESWRFELASHCKNNIVKHDLNKLEMLLHGIFFMAQIIFQYLV